jgi:hypothetical protein
MSCTTLVLNGNIATLDRAQAQAVSEVRQEYWIATNRPVVRLNWIIEKDDCGRNQLRMQWSPAEVAR